MQDDKVMLGLDVDANTLILSVSYFLDAEIMRSVFLWHLVKFRTSSVIKSFVCFHLEYLIRIFLSQLVLPERTCLLNSNS